MNPFLVIIITLFSLLVFWNFWMFIKSKRSVGKSIPYENLSSEFSEKIKNKFGIIYFYSQSCHHCKMQTEIINKIKEQYKNVLTVDVSENVSISRALNVMGTPTLIFFGRNKIREHFVGVKDESFIVQKFTSLV